MYHQDIKAQTQEYISEQAKQAQEALTMYQNKAQADLEYSWNQIFTSVMATVTKIQDHLTHIQTEAVAQLGDSFNLHFTQVSECTSRELDTWNQLVQSILHQHMDQVHTNMEEADTCAIAIVDCFTAQLDEHALEVMGQFKTDVHKLCDTTYDKLRDSRTSYQTHTIPTHETNEQASQSNPERSWQNVDYEKITSGTNWGAPTVQFKERGHQSDPTGMSPPLAPTPHTNNGRKPIQNNTPRNARDFKKAPFDGTRAFAHHMGLEQFYNRFQQHASIHNIPILHLQNIVKGQPLYPKHLSPDSVAFYSHLQYYKLPSIDVILDTFPQF